MHAKKLADIELMGRLLMALILITAGTSKLLSDGGFASWYLSQFANESLRIQLPAFLVEIFLHLVPFIEIGLDVALLIIRLKPWTTWAWFLFMACLLFGHYVLQEWSSVNQMLMYFLLGMLVHVLPTKAEI